MIAFMPCFSFWAERFPDRKPEHYVFPSERYGAAGDDFTAHTYLTDPTKPINRLKESWERAKANSSVKCRFHDLRHTACTRLLEGGVSLPVVASILGWSAATTVRMAKRYGHIGQSAQREAVRVLDRVHFEPDGAQKEAQSRSDVHGRPVFIGCLWCRRRESNPHTREGRGILSPLRLPFRHSGSEDAS